MILPFVRELFADVEKSAVFARAATHLKNGAGRMGVSGLTATAKALHISLLHRAAGKPLLVIVSDNRAAEQMLPVVQAFCELTDAADPERVISLPAHDVLPFENLSPHPEIQEARASTLWKIASGAASIVVTPAAASAMRLRSAEHYTQLARVLRRGETTDPEKLVEHLNISGYSPADVVEMPGQYALRGGIFDVYPPEADRPLRIEFFGDDVESIRKFDPATQRSSAATDEAVLLPLTETPISEEVLAAIHTRLSGQRLSGSEEMIEQAVRAGGATVFPGWEFYAPVSGGGQSLFDFFPEAAVLVDEPATVRREFEHWYAKLAEAHERSGVGALLRPEELYADPEDWWKRLQQQRGLDVEHLGITAAAEELAFSSQPGPRFHGMVPAMVEEVRKLTAEGQRVLFAAPNMGEAERLAEMFSEYNIAFRLGSRAQKSSDTYLDEAAYFSSVGEVATTTIVKAFIPDGVILPEAGLALFGASDLFDESPDVITQPQRRRSKVSAFLSDFRDLAVGDYVVHVEHGIGQYQGLKEINQGDGDGKAEFMLLEYAE